MRSTRTVETEREVREGMLADLGNALVCLELIRTRARVAVRVTGHARLLEPVIEDSTRAEGLIRRAQGVIAADIDRMVAEGQR